jgi:hypothetical protein
MFNNKDMESLRTHLNDIVNSDDCNLFEGEILRKSQELDEIIISYYNKNLDHMIKDNN